MREIKFRAWDGTRMIPYEDMLLYDHGPDGYYPHWEDDEPSPTPSEQIEGRKCTKCDGYKFEFPYANRNTCRDCWNKATLMRSKAHYERVKARKAELQAKSNIKEQT